MKKLFLIAFLFSSIANAQLLYNWKVEKVLDGDTIKFKVDFLPIELKPYLSVRINGVDTPEKKPRNKCEKEDALAQAASAFTKSKIASAKSVKVKLDTWDKYGGRVLGDVILDDKPLSKMLIDSGYAREYHGEAKKTWCE